MPFSSYYNLFPNTNYNIALPEKSIQNDQSRIASATFYLQDPSTLGITGEGVRVANVNVTGNRLANSMITSIHQVNPNPDGNFIFSPLTPEFNITNAFVIANLVVNRYKKILQTINAHYQFSNWQWGSGQPLTVNVYAGMEQNAFYARPEKALNFFYFPDPSGKIVYTSESLDVVAHETGHAVLDALMPGYFNPTILGRNGELYPNPETGALHEAFGDLTAIFLLLSLPGVSELLIKQTNGNLHIPNFLNSLAEEFGHAVGQVALRNADNDLTFAQATNGYTDFEVHQLSNVFTGAIYDIFVDFFNLNKVKNPETLIDTAENLQKLLLMAIFMGPQEGASYTDVVLGMMKLEPDPVKRNIIQYQFFTKRGLCRMDYQGCGMPELISAQYNKNPDNSRSCSTLPHHACRHEHAISKCINNNANRLRVPQNFYCPPTCPPTMLFSRQAPEPTIYPAYTMDATVNVWQPYTTIRSYYSLPVRYRLG